MAQLKSTNITGNLAVTGNILASKIIKLGGTADQILLANGDVATLSNLGAGNVTGSNLTNNTIILGGGSSSVKTSSKTIATSVGSDDTTVPTSKAVKNYVTGLGYITGSYLPLAGGEMSGPITYPVASGNNKTSNYISAGGGYDTGSGKEGLKILALEQSDATMGLGVDLTGGDYELTVATSRGTNTTASKIVFATHTVGTTAYKALATLSASGAENPAATLNVNGALEVSYTESGTQPSAAKILSVNNASTDHTGWRGRLVVGAKNKTFLMGTYKGLCVLGAHSWSDALAGTGAAWEDMYFNPDGGAKLYFGNRGYVIDSGVIKVENPSNSSASAATAYLNTGTLGDPVWGRIAVTSDIKNGTLTMATSGTGISGSATFTANQNTASNFTVTLNSSAAGNRAASQVVLAAAAGQINSDKFAVSGSGTVKATWQYNSTTDCIELVWA